jgi:hypothetical protein
MPIVKKDDGTIVVNTRITLKPGRDDNLIDLLLQADNMAGTIREAMRNGVQGTFEISESEAEEIDFDLGIEL